MSETRIRKTNLINSSSLTAGQTSRSSENTALLSRLRNTETLTDLRPDWRSGGPAQQMVAPLAPFTAAVS